MEQTGEGGGSTPLLALGFVTSLTFGNAFNPFRHSTCLAAEEEPFENRGV